MTENVMLDQLPESWKGYQINTSFRIGIQIMLMQDADLNEYEKMDLLIYLMFEDRDHPEGSELEECANWFINGWYHDNPGTKKDKRKLVDYDVDQWRIYADFRQIYGIDLATDEMHWWTFNGLLWNMPNKLSSFMEVIDIRRKKIMPNMSNEEKSAIREAQKIYSLNQVEAKYSENEKMMIDEYDKMMAQRKARKEEQEEILKEFRK